MPRRKTIVLSLSFLLVVIGPFLFWLIIGHEDRQAHHLYDEIHNDMKLSEVVELIGVPIECPPTDELHFWLSWEVGNHRVYVRFQVADIYADEPYVPDEACVTMKTITEPDSLIKKIGKNWPW